MISSGGWGGICFLSLYQLLVVAGNPWCSLKLHSSSLWFQCHMLFPHVCVSLSPNNPLIVRTPVTGVGSTLLQCDLILTWIHLQTLLPNKFAFTNTWSDYIWKFIIQQKWYWTNFSTFNISSHLGNIVNISLLSNRYFGLQFILFFTIQ